MCARTLGGVAVLEWQLVVVAKNQNLSGYLPNTGRCHVGTFSLSVGQWEAMKEHGKARNFDLSNIRVISFSHLPIMRNTSIPHF